MANAEKAAFFEKYAPLAMVQQQKYGIPASVTLAQMYIESGGGTSRLAVEGNNYFGIKCSNDWLAAGKPYSLHSDDKPNEKFCNYGSVEESVQHHSQFLMGNRYADCRSCASDDYRGWAYGLQAAGYATDRHYADALIADIEAYDLQRYDQMAIQDARQKGLTVGYAKGSPDDRRPEPTGHWVMPLAGNELVQTCEYGDRRYHPNGHNGVDFRAAEGTVVRATEDNGVIVSAGWDKKGGGNYVYVRYDRSDGSNYEVGYLHLSKIDVTFGDSVSAGQAIGLSGNTGSSTAPHLDFRVKKDGQYINPLDYLGEVAVRGHLDVTIVPKGGSGDLLASHKEGVDTTPTPSEVIASVERDGGLTDQQRQNAEEGAVLANAAGSSDPKNMLSYLLGMNGDQQYSQGGDLFSSIISSLFMAAIAMAMQLDHGDNADSQSMAAADERRQQETEEQKASTLVRRQRESVDPEKAHELLAMYFESECPEERQERSLRQCLS